jgi:Cu/Ag efflux protein CusF
MKTKFASLLSVTAAVALATLSASPVMAGAHEKPGGSISASTTRTATVTKIDPKDRWVTLKRADGTSFDIQAGPAVKNFAQIKVGDQLVVSEQDTVTIEVLPAGQAAPNVTGGTAMVGAPAGAKPMGVIVDTIVITGAVTAIDYAKRTVTLVGPEGNSRTFEVGPAATRFDAVKKGDNVVVTLKVSTTLEVITPPKK